MFIITFILGIKTLSKKVVNEMHQDNFEAEGGITESKPNEEQSKGDNYSNTLDKDEIYEEEKQETIIQEPQKEDINYVGLGIISISTIFLLSSIFFAIIFTKYQLKRNRKSSK